MRLDGALADKKAPCNAGVGQTLGHQLEHLARGLTARLAGRCGGCDEQAPDDVRIKRRATACDALGRIEKLVDGEHAVLEEVAEATECDELDGVVGLDVLGEQQHSDLWMIPLDLICGASALVGEGWRHPNVGHARSGRFPATVATSSRASPRDAATSWPRSAKSRASPSRAAPGPRRSRRAWQLRGQDRASLGSTLDTQAAAMGRDPVVQPAQTPAELLDDTADAVVGDADDEAAVGPSAR